MNTMGDEDKKEKKGREGYIRNKPKGKKIINMEVREREKRKCNNRRENELTDETDEPKPDQK